jgi:hypothetical protein
MPQSVKELHATSPTANMAVDAATKSQAARRPRSRSARAARSVANVASTDAAVHAAFAARAAGASTASNGMGLDLPAGIFASADAQIP